MAAGVKGTPETKGLVTSVGTTIGGLKTPGGVVGKTIGGGGGGESNGGGGGGGGGVTSGGVMIGPSNGPSNGPSKGPSRAACAKADGAIIDVAQKVIIAGTSNQLTCCLTEGRPLTMVQNPYNLCFGHVSTRFCWVNYSKLDIVFCSV